MARNNVREWERDFGDFPDRDTQAFRDLSYRERIRYDQNRWKQGIRSALQHRYNVIAAHRERYTRPVERMRGIQYLLGS